MRHLYTSQTFDIVAQVLAERTASLKASSAMTITPWFVWTAVANTARSVALNINFPRSSPLSKIVHSVTDSHLLAIDAGNPIRTGLPTVVVIVVHTVFHTRNTPALLGIWSVKRHANANSSDPLAYLLPCILLLCPSLPCDGYIHMGCLFKSIRAHGDYTRRRV